MNLPCAAVVRLSRKIEVKELGAMAALLDCNPPRSHTPLKAASCVALVDSGQGLPWIDFVYIQKTGLGW